MTKWEEWPCTVPCPLSLSQDDNANNSNYLWITSPRVTRGCSYRPLSPPCRQCFSQTHQSHIPGVPQYLHCPPNNIVWETRQNTFRQNRRVPNGKSERNQEKNPTTEMLPMVWWAALRSPSTDCPVCECSPTDLWKPSLRGNSQINSETGKKEWWKSSFCSSWVFLQERHKHSRAKAKGPHSDLKTVKACCS